MIPYSSSYFLCALVRLAIFCLPWGVFIHLAQTIKNPKKHKDRPNKAQSLLPALNPPPTQPAPTIKQMLHTPATLMSEGRDNKIIIPRKIKLPITKPPLIWLQCTTLTLKCQDYICTFMQNPNNSLPIFLVGSPVYSVDTPLIRALRPNHHYVWLFVTNNV